MGSICSDPAAGLCLAVTAVLGGMAFGKFRKSPGQMWNRTMCLAGLWGITCLLGFSLCWGLVLVYVSCLLFYKHLSGQQMLPVHQKAILITGTDSGIGHGLAKYLDGLGFTVFATVLNENGSGAEELRRTCSSRLSVIQMDVTNSEQIREARRKVEEKVQDRGLWALINNAGILGFPAEGELMPITHYRRCMDVNFFGPIEIAKTFLPLLRKSKGRLVNISSLAAKIPMEKGASYASTKAALTMFTEVLRLELHKWGIKAAAVHPGSFRTSIAGTEELWDKMEKNLLDNLAPDVLEDYGQDFILAQREFLCTLDSFASADYTPFLVDIRHAILSKNPLHVYMPGYGSFLWYLVVSLFPTGVFDHLMRKARGFPMKPKALRLFMGKNKAT
ncbi:PREDICTED: estradiol 17-beta-dehydrogenase 2-like [Elephantulus edwardii]|uniref:estradiol 17-beta-dehydrogenase 2-like n=1 Tax=Elephantulus edwardii TaxID=28737 RepID=UPI0003F06672|nr:PREDICTED: estradiol 17-beta-dehydrogenase 2-like [Elephantulus edwardii]